MTQRIRQIFLVLGDLSLLFLCLFITTVIYKDGQYIHDFFIRHVEAFSYIFPIWIVTYYIEGLYSLNTYNRDGLIISLIRIHIINALITFVFFYLFSYNDLSPRTNIIVLSNLSAFAIYAFRKIFWSILSFRGMSVATLIISEKPYINEIQEHLDQKPYLGFNLIKNDEQNPDYIPQNTQLIAVDRTKFGNKELLHTITKKMSEGVQLIEMTKFAEIVTGKIPVNAINESWFIENCTDINNRSYRVLKSLMDKSIAFIIFLFVLPIYLLLIPILLIFSGRPIFYSQIRTGVNNRGFRIYKLRTMTVDAERGGAKWAQPQDARVTTIGKMLRKTRLDEIPQLWNILNGDMSLVGPRPERPEIIKEKLEPIIPFYNFRHLVKPGVTGWAQVNFRYGFSQDDSIKKLQYDLYYVKNKSIWLDIKIILKTVKTVITGMGQ